MNAKKAKSVSTSSKGRGRSSRSQPVRPQVQSQPPPYYPQISPQPAHYYPQPPPMYLPSHQHQYYPQPPSMNPSQYMMSMTSDFDPFNDYHEGPSWREPSVERELPLYNYEDDDVEYVPEMQQENPIGILVFFYVPKLPPWVSLTGYTSNKYFLNSIYLY